MNSSFRAAVAQYKQAAPVLTHAQRTCRLYRRALKTLNSWAVDRAVFLAEASQLRGEFEAKKGLGLKQGELVVADGEAALLANTHPDPYTPAYMPGSSLYMRNSPLPLAVVFDDATRPSNFRNPDLSPVVPGHKGTVGPVLVDAAAKKLY